MAAARSVHERQAGVCFAVDAKIAVPPRRAFGPAVLEEVLEGDDLGADALGVERDRVLVAEPRPSRVVLSAGLVVLVAWPAPIAASAGTSRQVDRAIDDLLPEAR